MTTKEKGELITYINYVRAKGEYARKTARKSDLAESMSNWLMGSGNARLEVADELMKFIESGEMEYEQK